MFNLIKKDFVIQKAQILFFIPLIMFFAIFADDMNPAFVFFLAAAYIPMNGYIYDGQVESNILLNSLPYTRKEIVSAKYIGAIAYMILTIAVASAILYVFNYNFMIRDIAIATGLFCIFSAIAFPLFYLLKIDYIVVVGLVGMVISAVVLPPLFRLLTERLPTITDFLTSLSTTTLYLSGAAISIILYLISWMVSQFIYQRKVF